MRWVWLAIAGGLGVWLLTLLLLSGPEEGTGARKASPEAAPRNATFDSPAVDAFPNRHIVKSSRQLPAFPVLPDERKRE